MFRSNAAMVEHGVEWVESGPPTGGATGMGGSAIIREPIGVVAAITPFNFPFMLNVVKTAPALAAGCTVVLKPHPWTPLDAFMIAAGGRRGRLPPGVFNVITGHGEVGDELTGNPVVDMVTFTGSTATGRRIMASAAGTVKKLQLELGGKSAQVVLGDVSEDYAADRLRRGADALRPGLRVAHPPPSARAAARRLQGGSGGRPARSSRSAIRAIREHGARTAHPRAAAGPGRGVRAIGARRGGRAAVRGKRPAGWTRASSTSPPCS